VQVRIGRCRRCGRRRQLHEQIIDEIRQAVCRECQVVVRLGSHARKEGGFPFGVRLVDDEEIIWFT